MSYLRNFFGKVLFFCLSVSLFFVFSLSISSAEEIDWVEVARTNNELLFVNTNSIKYNNKGFLSVLTKYSEIDEEEQNKNNSNLFLMAVDCENRLYSKLPIDSNIKQVKKWQNPTNEKLIKKAIVNSCSF